MSVEFESLDQLDSELDNFEAKIPGSSEPEKVDSSLIQKILFEMKSEFNKGSETEGKPCEKDEDVNDLKIDDSAEHQVAEVETKEPDVEPEEKESDEEKEPEEQEPEEEKEQLKEQEETEPEEKLEESQETQETKDINVEDKADENDEKTEIKDETDSSQMTNFSVPPQIEEVPLKKKRGRRSRQSVDTTLINFDEPLEKRTRRQSRFLEEYDQDVVIKRSSRRASKDSKQSVLKNAMARKEKSFSALQLREKPQRRSSRLSDEKSLRKSIKTRSQSEYDFNGDSNNYDEFDDYKKFKSKKENSDEATDYPTYAMSEDSESKPKTDSDSGEAPPNQHPLSEYSSLCDCESLTDLRPSESSLKVSDMCRAIDSFDEKFYLCCNPITSETMLLRTSKKTPYLPFCAEHTHRLFGHGACPPCGTFCTQGVFNICENKHVFHSDCVVTKEVFASCPHCGTDKFALHKLRMENHKYPLFLPIQKPINRERMARISFQYSGKLNIAKTTEESILSQTNFVLPNGKMLCSDGIPLSEKERLEEIIKHPLPLSDGRYTYRNLYQAAKIGDVERILAIIATGMNPNRESCGLGCLHAAASGGFLTAVHILVQAGTNVDTVDKNQVTPLMAATLSNHNDVIKYLVKVGASTVLQGSDGMTALHYAAKQGNLEACHIILSSIKTPESLVNIVDDGRWTPLVWAAENRHSKVVRYLLEKQADPHVRDGEMNIALHWSAFSGSMEITEDLLNFGSNINLSNVHGDTPLHIAARQGADECVTLLLARGARVDMMNKAGLTAKDCVINPDSYCLTAIELNAKISNICLKLNKYPQLLSNDISRGRESYPIQCFNAVDNDPMPTNYMYITENCFTSNLTIDRTITSLDPCKCDDMCYTTGCMCGKISQKCWYDNKGRLSSDFNFEDPPMLFECSEACSCNILTCKNRVVQKGIKAKLQLVKTKDKSWAVITLTPIPKGSYVCEYIGEIISDCEADTREDDSYLFDLDNREGGESYCLDARNYGNIARFVNHCCAPNLAPVRVFIGHRDLHFPRIAMFATRNIEAYEELGYDYGEKFWVIKGKSFTCKCNEEVCKYSEETINQTLEQYNEKMEMEESIS